MPPVIRSVSIGFTREAPERGCRVALFTEPANEGTRHAFDLTEASMVVLRDYLTDAIGDSRHQAA